VYDKKKPLPDPFKLTGLPFDDSVFVPKDNQGPWGPVTKSYASLRRNFFGRFANLRTRITVEADFETNDQGQNRATFNGISFVAQSV
jgi:hypothetical protein